MSDRASDPPVKPGDILGGKYRVDRVLGLGGMGVVVLATHLELGEQRAIKFMLPAALSSPDAVERFLREARAAARLKSDHVVTIHDVGRFADQTPYIVMELLDGSDLEAVIRASSTPPPIAESVSHVIQACDAIAEAHAAGIVHRDLKPANLFVSRRRDGSSSIKVLDFGISKATGADMGLTGTNALLGSPLYMAPEQMRSAKSADPRSDVWSIGVILYRLLTLKLPFEAQTLTELAFVVHETTPPPPSSVNPLVPPELDRIVMACLDREPAKRMPSADALSLALAPFDPRARTSVPGSSRDSVSRPSAPAQSAPALSFPAGAPAPMLSATGNAWGNTKSSSRAGAGWFVAAAVLLAAGIAGAFFLHRRAGGDVAASPAMPSSAQQSTEARTPSERAPASSATEPAPLATAVASAPSAAATGAAPRPRDVHAPPKPSPQPVQSPVQPPSDPFGSGRK